MDIDVAIELFEKAYSYNWDNGLSGLKKILKNDNCDKATALLIFWNGNPEFYNKFTLSHMKGQLKKNYIFLKEIEDDILNNKYSQVIKYDPSSFFDKNNKSKNNWVRTTSKELKISTLGGINSYDIIEGIIGLGAWFKAAENGNLELLKKLYVTEILNKKKSIDVKNQWGLSAFHCAIYNEEINSFEEIQNTLDFFIEQKTKMKSNVFINVTSLKKFTLRKIEFLLDNGVDINIKSKSLGETALFSVKEIKTANYLIQKGININSINNLGQTALHKLFNFPHEYNSEIQKHKIAPICEVLLESGIDVNIKCKKGILALDMAQEYRKTGDVKLSIQKIQEYYIKANKPAI